MATAIGLPVQECLEKCTERQLLAHAAWLSLEYNHPARIDHYLMRIAYEIAKANAKDPSKVELDKFRIEFKTKVIEENEKEFPASSYEESEDYSDSEESKDSLDSSSLEEQNIPFRKVAKWDENLAAKTKWLGALFGYEKAAQILEEERRQKENGR